MRAGRRRGAPRGVRRRGKVGFGSRVRVAAGVLQARRKRDNAVLQQCDAQQRSGLVGLHHVADHQVEQLRARAAGASVRGRHGALARSALPVVVWLVDAAPCTYTLIFIRGAFSHQSVHMEACKSTARGARRKIP